MIGFLKILKCSIMESNSWAKVMLVNLPKNSFSGQGQFGPKDLFEDLGHDEALDKSSLRHLGNIGNIGPFGSQLHNQLL